MQALREEIDKLLKVGIMYLVEIAEWVSLVLVMLRKDEKQRDFVDFRPLHEATKKGSYLFPFVD